MWYLTTNFPDLVSNNYLELLAPRAGVPEASNINVLHWQTAVRGSFDPERFSGALATHATATKKSAFLALNRGEAILAASIGSTHETAYR
jgi:hypothetical protein